jgi:NitT/TauT family transport system substrate-binding protein
VSPRPRLATATFVTLATAVALLAAACGGTPGSPSAGPTSVATPPATVEPTLEPVNLIVGLGFIPSVQFAPFYLAQQAGYYEDAGLVVEFQNRIDPDLITLVGQGAVDVGMADGTSVIPAVSQGIPIRYLATVYGRFPSIVFARTSSGITTAADLAGRKLGIPGRYGSSWIMLQALLGSAGLSADDLEIVEYPDFGQGAAVTQGAVDAATGFANNEPVVLARTGESVVVLRIDDVTALPGPGLIAGVSTLETKADAIAAFVAATLLAMEEIAADPSVGLDAAITAVPELASDPEGQAAILAATIESWRGTAQLARGLGAIDRDGWAQSIAFMTTLGLVPNPVTVDDLVRADLLPAGD